MPTKIRLGNPKIHMELQIHSDFSLSLLGVSTPARETSQLKSEEKVPAAPPLSLQITGESSLAHHGYQQTAGSRQFQYEEREEYQNHLGKKVEISLSSQNDIQAVWHLQFFNDISVFRSWVTVINCGEKPLGMESVSSFLYRGLCREGALPLHQKTKILVPYHSWCEEVQWKSFSLNQLGLSQMPIDGHRCQGFGISRYAYGNFGSWSTCGHLPVGIVQDTETNEAWFWQIESSCGWHTEYQIAPSGQLTVGLYGPTENESHWWKQLQPGEQFTTVPVAFGVVSDADTLSAACQQLTLYRRAIRRLNEDNLRLHLVFNDFMNCLEGDPTEDREYPLIDCAAKLGAEYYCIDAGWYDKGFWWDRVGEWRESSERFPNGLRKVTDYIRSKGMKAGIWLEIEVIGAACPLAQKLPDDWFFCRHGKRHIDHGRYLLDFRNPEVLRFATEIIERMMDDYGIEFFKIDYNVTTSIGTDYQSDSCGDGLLEHTRALYRWYDELYRKYPHLIIENCGSGGQRMDYGLLSRHSLQSVTDQTDAYYNACIAANAASALTPEQAGIWVYPYQDTAEHVVFNLINGILLRPYLSGQVCSLSESSLQIMQEGIAVYREIRGELKDSLPCYPLGFSSPDTPVIVYSAVCRQRAFLAVFALKELSVKIPLCFPKEVASVKQLYPAAPDCEFYWEDRLLSVTLPALKTARLFELLWKEDEK